MVVLYIVMITVKDQDYFDIILHKNIHNVIMINVK
jgi:hypothetical protein